MLVRYSRYQVALSIVTACVHRIPVDACVGVARRVTISATDSGSTTLMHSRRAVQPASHVIGVHPASASVPAVSVSVGVHAGERRRDTCGRAPIQRSEAPRILSTLFV